MVKCTERVAGHGLLVLGTKGIICVVSARGMASYRGPITDKLYV